MTRLASTEDSPATLYDWFARSAARHSNAVALEAGGETLTYGELADRSERIASALLRAHHGTRPRRIGLVAMRDAATYAGYLAIQRLGAAAVPLNPAFPATRTAAIISAARLDLVVGPPIPAVALPVVIPDEAADATDLPAPCHGPADTAYILFTSGSTGTPKGIPITHRNATAYLSHVVPRYAAGPGSRFSQTFDITFDVSVLDMFAAWGSGATLVVPAAHEVLTPVRFVSGRQITHWCSVPSVISYARRMRGLPPESMPTLRHSVFAGEQLTIQQAEAWHAAAPMSTIENGYGPTEMTVTCAGYRLPQDHADWPSPANGTVPIGPVFPHLEWLVLDETGHPAQEGELCLRGPQRLTGYLDPADNAGRFLEFKDGVARTWDQSRPPTDRSWYRTGDRVCLTNVGFVHLGRLDHQAKIRGYRIELSEIEAALRAHPGVHDAVALAVPDGAGGLDLHAVCTGDGPIPDVLSDLQNRLPAYMIPRQILAVEQFPLNSSGKIDRIALATLVDTRQHRD